MKFVYSFEIIKADYLFLYYFFHRLMTFAAMMRQECGWFDKEEHSVGILSSYLSGDAASVQTVKK